MIKVRRDFNKTKPRSQMNEKEREQDDIYNSDTTMEKILNSKKIRYEILNSLFSKIPKHITTVTMYIDVFSIINNLYNPQVLENISAFNDEKSFIFSSNLINLAAHFRNYFATRKQFYTNFVFYYSTEKSEKELGVYPDYRKEFYTKRLDNNSEFILMNNLIRENLKLCEILSNYLPHIYFVNTKELNPNLVPHHFIQCQEKDEMSIIYSNDKLQMIHCLQNKDTYLLTSSFGNVNLYSQMDLVELYNNKENYEINPQLLPYMFAFSGNKKYSVEGCKGYAELKTCKFFKKLLDQNVISNINYKEPSIFLNEIKNSISPEQYHILERNISLFHFPSMYMELTDKEILSTFTVKDLQDMKSLVEINAERYEKYPLHLEELMIGEDYESI